MVINKQEFLALLRKGLSGLPQEDIEERLTFYSEMIEDRMEEGLSEEDAVCQVGNVDELISQTIADIPLAKLVKERITPKKRLKTWEIALMVLGAPIWMSLLIAALSVILSLHVALWSVIITLWAVFWSLVGGALGGVVAGIGAALGGNGLTAIAIIGAGIACAGLSMFLFHGCKKATRGALSLTKKMALGIKHCFIKKEKAE